MDGCRQAGSVGQVQHTFASAVRIPPLFVGNVNLEYEASGFSNGAKHSTFSDITPRLLLHVEDNAVTLRFYGNGCMAAVSQSMLFLALYPVKCFSSFYP